MGGCFPALGVRRLSGGGAGPGNGARLMEFGWFLFLMGNAGRLAPGTGLDAGVNLMGEEWA